MFKIVHCKTSDDDVIRILDNVEETSLSAVQEEDDAEDEEEEEEEEEDVDIEDDRSTIEEAEYVHPDMEDYMDENDEATQQRYSNSEHNVHIDDATKCTCTHKGVKKKIEFGLTKCIHSRPCSICVYLCLTLMVLASIVALIVISVLIVVPYTKAASYQSSNCTPVGVSVDPEDKRCSCGKGCSSLYPCLQIRVLIAAVNYSYVDIRSSILYENEAVFMRKVGRSTCTSVQENVSFKIHSHREKAKANINILLDVCIFFL